MQAAGKKRKVRVPQRQLRQPGLEWKLKPAPIFFNAEHHLPKKLSGKTALITGGDSGIGRAVAVSFAKEGANVAILFLDEKEDAKRTKECIEELNAPRCLTLMCDISEERNCVRAVKRVIKEFGRIDILVNNAGVHFPKESILEIDAKQLEKTFRVNVFSMFYLVKATLPYMPEGGSIINTASVTAYRGSATLLDYASSKGAIVSFTRSLSASLLSKKIRVNGVAPGPIWTPLIAASFKPEKVATFGSDAPMQRIGQPAEVATCFVFLASAESSYITGQFLHPNGGEIVNS